ncbi:hypothetical protein Tco_1445747 [Tanacetum coccineum]
MEDPEQAFVEFASSRTDEAGEGLVSDFMASQDARLTKFEANFKRQQGEMTNKIDIVLKAIIDQIWGTLPSDTVKKKLGTHPKPVESQVNEPDMEQEEGNLGNTNSNPQSDPLALIATKQVQKLNSMLESLRDDDEPHNEDPNKDPRLSQVVLGRPFVEISNMTHDPPEGVVRFIRGADGVTYKMPHKIEQYDSLSDLEKEHTKSVYLRNEEDKRRGVEYVMSKILGFYKECLELGPEYLTGMDDEGEVT